MSDFSHLDKTGQLRMVEVGEKPVTLRQATATCRIVVGSRVFPRLLAADLPKGDVWAAARLAGIMAAKNTAQLIPLCHPLPLTGVDIDFTPEPEEEAVAIRATVRTQARTGVEMEALVAAGVAALTIYDMCKALDKEMIITDLVLVEKSGGKSGEYRRGPSKTSLKRAGHGN
jgi:cyclic pyranopterin monophosphate synthase